MLQSFLNTKQDLIWLRDVHLKNVFYLQLDFVSAILYGNEDCPDRVELFKKNHWRCIPKVYIRTENGLEFDEKNSKNWGKLKPYKDCK